MGLDRRAQQFPAKESRLATLIVVCLGTVSGAFAAGRTTADTAPHQHGGTPVHSVLPPSTAKSPLVLGWAVT